MSACEEGWPVWFVVSAAVLMQAGRQCRMDVERD